MKSNDLKDKVKNGELPIKMVLTYKLNMSLGQKSGSKLYIWYNPWYLTSDYTTTRLKMTNILGKLMPTVVLS